MRLLAGARLDAGRPDILLDLPEGAVRADLEDALDRAGWNPASREFLIVLNGKGLCQWPQDHPVRSTDRVSVFNAVSGG